MDTSTRERIRGINRAIRDEDRRLRAKYRWLERQDALGMACFLGSYGVMAAVAVASIAGGLPWWAAVPLMALPISILHELEHDLIHGLYFRERPRVQDAMFFGIWLAKLSISPWKRREIHLRHHRESGQAADFEERMIGLGLPLGPRRLFVTFHPLGAAAVTPALARDNRDFDILAMFRPSLPAFALLALICHVSAASLGLGVMAGVYPEWASAAARHAFVLWVAPNLLRQSAIVVMSSFSHYYGDIPENDVFYQNQILRHPALWPLQAFCFNFGSTHIIHHFVVDQPFYLRQMVARAAHAAMEQAGVRVNDGGTVKRANRYAAS
jgi:fatty acid desaturase